MVLGLLLMMLRPGAEDTEHRLLLPGLPSTNHSNFLNHQAILPASLRVYRYVIDRRSSRRILRAAIEIHQYPASIGRPDSGQPQLLQLFPRPHSRLKDVGQLEDDACQAKDPANRVGKNKQTPPN